MIKRNGVLSLVRVEDLQILKTNPELFWEDVREIGEYAFSGVGFSGELVVPNSVKKIGNYAFSESFFRKVVLPRGLKEAGKGVFMGSEELEEVVIQEGIEELPDKFFANCINLKKTTLPKSLKRLGNLACCNCAELEEVDLSNFEEIGNECYAQCKKLRKVVLSEKLKKIGEYCFRSSGVREAVIDGIEEVPDGLFYLCHELVKVSFNKPVKSLGKSVFEGNRKLNEISLLDGLEKIGIKTFKGCERLRKCNLPNGLKEIGYGAYSYCSHLEEAIMPDSVVEVGENVYSNSGVERVKLSSSLKKLPNEFFQDATNLKEVVAFDGLTEIGYDTFSGSGIQKFVMPNSVVKVGFACFSKCFNLEELVLSTKLKNLPNFLVQDCESLKKLKIHEGVEEIGRAFASGCSSLVEADLPNSVKKLEGTGYEGCVNLKKVKLSNQLEEISSWTFASSGVEEIEIGDKVRTVKENCFTGCTNLKKLTISKNVEELQNVNVPKTTSVYIETENGKVQMPAQFFNGNLKKENLETIREFAMRKQKAKFLPSEQVVLNMPKELVGNFFDQSKVWKKLLEDYAKSNSKVVGELRDETKADFFKLCLVSGIFSNSKFEREKANEFIETKIIGKVSGSMLHARFDGLKTVENGYNPFFAKFLINNFNENFLLIEVDADTYFSYISDTYNRFEQIQEAFGISRNTSALVNKLTEDEVVKYLFTKKYNYKKGTSEEKLANLCGIYGYSVEGFEKLKSWVYEGEKVRTEGRENLFCEPDYVTRKDVVTYEFLEKGDPVGAVLGNITNCCQKLDGAGESCCKHGLTDPNGGFIVFKLNDKIVGQSWVWFDGKSKKVCLDNVEVPNTHEKTVLNDEIKFNECLKRVKQGFTAGMNEKISYVTMGMDHNDIEKIVKDVFPSTKVFCALSAAAVQLGGKQKDFLAGHAPQVYTDTKGGELVL